MTGTRSRRDESRRDASRSGRPRADGGFTLVEMLVVIGILAVLTGLLVPTIGAIRRRSEVKRCKAFIEALAHAVESYEKDFGDFPPTSLGELDMRVDRVNAGNESLVRCLTTTLREGPYIEFQESDLGNTDEDKTTSRVDPTKSALTTRDLLEVLDPWGNPYIYFHSRDYRGGRNVERYVIGEEGQQVCRPEKSEKTGQFPGFNKFVIWSAGPDGVNENGAGDDVCSWK